jgi:hypothetical protein
MVYPSPAKVTKLAMVQISKHSKMISTPKHKWVKSSSTLHNHAKAMRKVSYRKIAQRKPISLKNLLMLENFS